MTEKETFLKSWERESSTTLKILKQLPHDKADFTPTKEKTKSAKALAEVFVLEMGVIDQAIKGKIDFTTPPPKFATYADVLRGYESTYAAMSAKVKNMSDADYNSTISFPAGPNKMADVRKADVFWLMMQDSIHHRGQFSIYLRLVGAKVPSIYGPSADEPWM
jgi:uncharacterized damage-inducible protein DinB